MLSRSWAPRGGLPAPSNPFCFTKMRVYWGFGKCGGALVVHPHKNGNILAEGRGMLVRPVPR